MLLAIWTMLLMIVLPVRMVIAVMTLGIVL